MLTKTYCIVRLLQLEPMGVEDIVLVGGLGWDIDSTRELVRHLCADRILTSARDNRRGFCLAAPFDEILRRLRDSEQRARAPAGVVQVQPCMPGLRGAGHLLRQAHAHVVRAAPKRVDVLNPADLALVRARRGGAARRRRPIFTRMAGVGS